MNMKDSNFLYITLHTHYLPHIIKTKNGKHSPTPHIAVKMQKLLLKKILYMYIV